MKLLNTLLAFTLILFIGCGGESSDQKETNTSTESETTEMAADDVRTIEITGIDQMKFVVDDNQEGITVGDAVGGDGMLLLESISAEPGEEIRIRLITKSSLPANAMAHNWILLTMGADGQAFATAAAQAKDNDYIPADKENQIIAQTGLAAGGETVEVTFTAPEEPGDYEYICSFAGHYAAGMKGMLNVEGSGASSEESTSQEG
ncbi:plastocyanin/azurin family copper-binding protein [Fodinibius saliphilus]|uniref:plastocyanin/azurin family copper-binding protein n=1 Tax=Fodinibius saliphilus TaxID=1920650 RepID=UPI001108548D|nr:plastocyanin/azurin family copper-binding protein [Fodinibius saliphilus]